MSHTHLITNERNFVARSLAAGWSIRRIANILGRSPSTVSREIARCKDNYDPKVAQLDYEHKRLSCRMERKLESVDNARHVLDRLSWGWSPEQIAGRDKLVNGTSRVSARTIYRAIDDGLLPAHTKYLLTRKGKRKRSDPAAERRGKIPDTLSIDERPAFVATRKRFGHWEGDTVRGAQGSGAIVTLVEMKSRFIAAKLLPDGRAETLADAVKQLAKTIRIKTLTVDNGKEFAHHKAIEEETGVKVYFAHPYSPWERGTNENTNGRLRRWFPKGSDMRKVSEADLIRATERMNSTPRKCLGYRTPSEVYLRHR